LHVSQSEIILGLKYVTLRLHTFVKTLICFHLILICNRDNNLEESDLELFFLSDYDILGKKGQHELKPGGAQIAVTEENKLEYIGYDMISIHFK